MPKVELNDVRIAMSPLTQKIYLCTLNADGSAKEKVEVTDMFTNAVIDFWMDSSQEFYNEKTGDRFEVSVTKVPFNT